MHKGPCLSGAVALDFTADLDATSTDQYGQCRKQPGQYYCAIAAPKKAIRCVTDAGLAWYRRTEFATYGFCGTCGTFPFWLGHTNAYVVVAMGSLDGLTWLQISGRDRVDPKGDYDCISDRLPQHMGEAA